VQAGYAYSVVILDGHSALTVRLRRDAVSVPPPPAATTRPGQVLGHPVQTGGGTWRVTTVVVLAICGALLILAVIMIARRRRSAS
jgi:type IV secretory pathway VirB3-like protein